jgi:hypothetical protein
MAEEHMNHAQIGATGSDEHGAGVGCGELGAAKQVGAYRAYGETSERQGALADLDRTEPVAPDVAVDIVHVERDELARVDAARVQDLEHRPITQADGVIAGRAEPRCLHPTETRR